MPKTSESLSLNKEVKMYGVTIKKMPNGRYFKAIQTIQDLPEEFIKEVLDGNSELKISELFNVENIITLITKLLIILPDFTFRFLSEVMDIEYDVLENQLTPLQTVKLIKKFVEINELSDFFQEMKQVAKKLNLNKMTDAIGFKGQ